MKKHVLILCVVKTITAIVEENGSNVVCKKGCDEECTVGNPFYVCHNCDSDYSAEY